MSAQVLSRRLLVAAWGIPLLIGTTYIGGHIFNWIVITLAVGCQLEYYNLQSLRARKPMRAGGLLGGIIILILWAIQPDWLLWALALAFISLGAIGIPLRRTHDDALASFAGIVYCALLTGTLISIRQWSSPEHPDGGRWAVMTLWAALWLGDTAAYAVGSWWGRHKLSPVTSPNKTIEGAIAGLVAALGVGLLSFRLKFLPLDIAIAVGIATGIFGQMGDLFESKLKREAGVKDSGRFLPGHGGFLDRFDSLIAAAPAAAVYIALLK